MEHHQGVRVFHRQLAQQDLVHQRKDGGVRTNSQCEGENRNCRE